MSQEPLKLRIEAIGGMGSGKSLAFSAVRSVLDKLEYMNKPYMVEFICNGKVIGEIDRKADGSRPTDWFQEEFG